MQLTRLDVKGFKSFGDKITINFDEGITSIVGPNGCGKSNVVDAIRWVLGEQSTRTLRSEKMENIIFNGTNTRKAAQLAEVSLSFSNNKNILPTDFSQVTITRKLYRNGDSEYRLNDVQCRLKDITDLFLDTGIGSDSYAIIELKMVEEIINNKDHSRRSLFEEASGISKYKIRKKQTISRLKDTELDLSRVEDLLFEIKKNLNSLEKQAKKTKRYFQLKEQYKSLSLKLASLRIAERKQSLNRIEKQRSEQQVKSTTLSLAIDQKEKSLLELKNEILVNEQHLVVQQKKLNQQLAEIRNYETEKKIKNEQLSNFNKRQEQLTRELGHDKQQKLQIQTELKRLQEDSLEANTLLGNMEIELARNLEESKALSAQQSQGNEKLKALTQAKNELQKNINELEKEITVLSIQCDALVQESTRSIKDEKDKENELATFYNERIEIKNQIDALKINLSSVQEREQLNKNTITEHKNDLENLKEKASQNSRHLDAKRNEYQLTKSMVDNLEGFPESIRYLKKNTNWNKQHLLFSDVLLCKEEYRIAIEHLLEPYMNYFIVDTFQEAYHGLELLNHAGKGKAGFFVLKNLPDRIESIPAPAHLIPAISVIEVEEKYMALCQYLLHAVYLQTQPQSSDSTAGQFTLLDPSGKFIQRRFSLVGGSVGLFDGKRIGRGRNLEELAKEIKKLTKKQQEAESTISHKAEILTELQRQTQNDLIEKLKGEFSRLEKDYISIQSKQEQFQDFQQKSMERKQDIELKIAALQQALLELKPKLLLLQKDRAHMEEDLLKMQEDIDLTSLKYSSKSAEYNLANLHTHQQKNKVAGIDKDIEYREIQGEDIESQIALKEKEFHTIQQEIQNTLLQVDISDEDIKSFYEEKEALEVGLKEVEQSFYRARGAVTSMENELSILRKNKEISDTLLHELKDQMNHFHIELNGIKERLSIEFSLDIHELQSSEEILEDETELSAHIQKIKKQLDDFGAINPIAMEAFQEMNDRFLFIQNEKKDLLEARETLLKTIDEIDLNAKDKFMYAFNKVRENFKIVFRSLFNEQDTCDLIITDPNNPLESDIDIIAHPKGKRPLSINQLSGGEKTLTSTALLFSLYLLKPAPFCIFDEIDAPLDDTNIDKFNTIIREFSKDSQFIIISHNKRTIASTDIIYGVTMVESGISRVVAVDMRGDFN